jgi:uncharacterized Zn-finger protein
MPPRPTTEIVPPPEEILVTSKRVACDGGGGALGHPLVYMDMGDDDFVECGYCDRRFVLGKKRKAESEYHSPAARDASSH